MAKPAKVVSGLPILLAKCQSNFVILFMSTRNLYFLGREDGIKTVVVTGGCQTRLLAELGRLGWQELFLK